jgi:hypothetical protein
MKDGATVRDHLAAGVRRGQPLHKDLADVTPGPVPVAAACAVAAFDTLSATRGGGMHGPNALTLHDVQAYRATMGPLSDRDVRLILAMDSTYMREVSADE